MQLHTLLLASASLSVFVTATLPGIDLSKSYAPVYVDCPSDIEWIRPASKGLNPQEAEWVRNRKAVVYQSIAKYLKNLDLEGFNLSEYLKAINRSNHKDVPSIGYAISGGGWASAFTGTGGLRALDSRLPAAVEQRTGGLLQSLMYMSGLSGGSWPTTSFLAHNWPTADEIVDLWKPEIARPSPNATTQYAGNATTLFEDIAAKFEAGFLVTTADLFGRSDSYEFIPGPNGGRDVTFSDLAKIPAFKNHQAPFPLLHLTAILPNDPEFFGTQVPFENATTYEISPFEFGSWQGDLGAFTPTAWLGTHLNNGKVLNKSACVQGFDRAGFIMGSSAGGLNFWYIEDLSNGTLASFGKRSEAELSKHDYATSLARRQNNVVPLTVLDPIFQEYKKLFNLTRDEVIYSNFPNPFAGLKTTTPVLRNASNLRIVDGSELGQAIPLWSQIQPERHMDFIMAWDNDQDARPNGWNNGTNLYNTYMAAKRSNISFPIVPNPRTFIANNWTHSPVFFGCDAKLTTKNDTATPIVLYLANAPYSAYSNFSFAQETTSRRQMGEVFVNSFDILTQGNGTLDKEWAQCLGCAAIDRSVARVGMERTKQCQRCMDRYCWDGVSLPDVIAGPPGGEYEVTEYLDLEMVLKPGISFAVWNQTNPF